MGRVSGGVDSVSKAPTTTSLLCCGGQSHASISCTGGTRPTSIGIGLDSCVIPLKYGGLSLLQTTDYFYPLIDDPYLMGKIACANVVSDLYAMGVTVIDNILMLLAVSTKMAENEKFVISKLIIDGFKDAVREVGSKVTGGDTVINPWCTLGGVATAICTSAEYIMPENAEPGDELVLTKPLGTQVAVHAYQWLNVPERWEKVKHVVTEEEVLRGYQSAVNSMTKLNKTAAILMHKYGAHAATDVTGFGILGHAQNLATFQKKDVTFVIHNLPVISKMQAIDEACNNRFKLNRGYSPETSGGLLISMPRQKAAEFCNDFSSHDGCQAWVVGIVEEGNKSARIIEKPKIIEVTV